MRPTLPRLVRRSPTGLAYFVYWAPFIALYQATNRWPLLEPRELPLSWLDRAIPFEPAFLPAYVGYLPLYWWTVMRSRNDDEVNRLLYFSYLQLLLCLPFFLLFPVTMPRHLYYQGEPFNWADVFWRWFDGPNNCFPSLHVSNALMMAYFNARRPWPILHLTLSALVIASTLLVKQHYAVDVAAGAGVFAVAAWIMGAVEITPFAGAREAPAGSRAPPPGADG